VVTDKKPAHIRHLYRFRTESEFRSHVEFFLRFFVPVSLDDIVEALNGRRSLPGRCFHFTFDDGFSEMHDVVAPILYRMGAAATFFLTTAFVDNRRMAHHNVLSLLIEQLRDCRSRAAMRRLEDLLPSCLPKCGSLEQRILSLDRDSQAVIPQIADILEFDVEEYLRSARPYLTSSQIMKLIEQGFTIGSHSHDHPLYRDISPGEQLNQTRTSTDFLDRRFGLKTKAFAFPHTDSGVEPGFFDSVFSSGLLDVTFGTGGLVPHYHPRNIERVKMEGTGASPGRILAHQLARNIWHRFGDRKH
jgi:peptidoglycan/xylan/chitin deacetylase (PgdA/CDA1 family)